MVILDLWGISFQPAVVVGLGNDLLFNSILAHCAGEALGAQMRGCLNITVVCILVRMKSFPRF
jgi:hypothetical protein